MPSLDDVIADHVFPQAPFAHTEAQIACKAESLGLEDLATSGETDAERRILVVPNPGSFTVGGVRFAAITNDVVRMTEKRSEFQLANFPQSLLCSPPPLLSAPSSVLLPLLL